MKWLNIRFVYCSQITRSRNKWKFYLKDGIMNIGGKDYIFQKSNGDAEWWSRWKDFSRTTLIHLSLEKQTHTHNKTNRQIFIIFHNIHFWSVISQSTKSTAVNQDFDLSISTNICYFQLFKQIYEEKNNNYSRLRLVTPPFSLFSFFSVSEGFSPDKNRNNHVTE